MRRNVLPKTRIEYELSQKERVHRGPACINVRREDKRIFDAAQAWAAVRMGRPVHQWEAFSLLLAAAMENEDSDFARAASFLPSG